MAEVSSARKNNFDILQEGIFNLYVDNNLDLFERQAASIMKLYDVRMNDYSFASGYFHLCTAFGKSYLIKAMAMSYNAMQSGKKIIVLEENQSVVKQMARELTVNSSLRKSDIGMFFSESKDTDTPIIVCTYASMKKMIERVGRENIGLVLCDEAHHILSENRQNVAREFADCALYGFTATSDYGIQDKNCATVFGPVIDSVTVRDGIERDGLLCSTKTGLFLSNIPVDLTRAIAPGHEDYDPNILDELLRASHVGGLRRGLADWYLNGVDDTIGNVFGKQTIINVPTIAEAERVAREFNTAAVEKGKKPIAHAYHTKTSDAVLDEFNAGKFPVLVQVNKISEGYNNPNVAICINYPTHSMVRSIQRSGRALRFNPNDPNKCALVMDIAFARRAPDEGATDVLSAIYENGQRLFYDVLGTVQCMNPADKRTSGDGKQSENPRPRESVALPSVFRVVTSVEFTNMVLEHVANNSDVEIKTSEWLIARELAGKYIVGDIKKIHDTLKQYADKMPNDIQVKRSGSLTALCLRRGAIDEFCKLSGLERADATIGEKTSEWLTASELNGKYIVGDYRKIRNTVKQYADKMPNDIRVKRSGPRTALCLRRGAIDEFCKLAGLKRADERIDKSTISEKISEWLTASELAGKYIVGDIKKIRNTLEQYADKMPNGIQVKRSGTNTVLCLRRGAIDEFCKLSGLKRADATIGEKTSEWLTARDLAGKYIVGDYRKILRAIEQYAAKMSNDIQVKQSGPRTALCLRRGAIDEFCKLADLKRVNESIDKSQIGEKTTEWLGANELTGKYIVGSPTKIRDALKQYADKMSNDIQVKRNGPRTVLCLRRGAIDEFCKLSGLNRADERIDKSTISEKTTEWLGANELTGKYIVGSPTKIRDALKQYADKIPNDVQPKHSGKRTVLCLHRGAIDEFCKLAGLKRVNERIDKSTISEKTSEWLTVRELKGKYIIGRFKKIHNTLKQYADKMPNDIQVKRSGSLTALCLRRGAIDEFCKLSGLKRKSDGFKSGEKNVGALDSVQKTKRKIKPNKNQNVK